jgi:hypothetical protein
MIEIKYLRQKIFLFISKFLERKKIKQKKFKLLAEHYFHPAGF